MVSSWMKRLSGPQGRHIQPDLYQLWEVYPPLSIGINSHAHDDLTGCNLFITSDMDSVHCTVHYISEIAKGTPIGNLQVVTLITN